MKKALGVIIFLVLYSSICAQGNVKSDAPSIFIDCLTWCHRDFIKQELSYVNHMLDRQSAEVFIQITSQNTGGGGQRFQVEIKGSGRFDHMTDTLFFNLIANVSDNERRETMLSTVQEALLPYLLKTSMREKITFEIDSSIDDTAEEVIVDPWKSWIFNVRINGNTNGQEAYNNLSIYSRLSASKVTDDVKIQPRIFYNLDRNVFSFEDEEDDVFVNVSSGASLKYVKSINDHFSMGFFSEVRESTFSNYDLSFSFQPAVEYNYFPYDEVQKRRLSALYRVGPQFNNYIDTTLFDKEREWLYRHSLEIEYTQVEDWGSFDIQFTSGNYLHDWSLLFVAIEPYIELNIIKGLSLNFGGTISMNRNQVNIPKGDASRDDVLLQQIQLLSNYSYYGWMGIGYRFGSQYNNIVNARF